MKLAPLLAALPDSELDRLALEHVRPDEKLSRPRLCNFLETALRSYRFVQQFVINRQPPTFAILTLLLDAPDYELPVVGFRDAAMEETRRILNLLDSGELLARDDGLQLYRAALCEARRNDLDLNTSEAKILGTLRRELSIAQVEHFLIEHHGDLREFWDKENSFLHEENALRSAGLVFVRDDKILIAEDVAPVIRHALGIEMPTSALRRLLGYFSGAELADALHAAGSRTAGTKDERVERILTERIQPGVVLGSVALTTLRDICRDAGAAVSGNKDELIGRIIDQFSQGKDQRIEEPPAPARIEDRRLDEERFKVLFGSLLHQELADILRRFPELRQTGTKDVRIATLWEAHLAEETLLGELMNRDLEDILHRLALRLSGSKKERITRTIDYFAASAETVAELHERYDPIGAALATPTPTDPEMLVRQELFRQKASSPQTALQSWLDEILEAHGLIRCYATEDRNPTKQLKNKLSQAAAARGGLLVLALVDEDAFNNAQEALVERWATNDEWPKSVACVALAYPLGTPTIRAIVEWTDSPFPARIRERLFPAANLLRANTSDRSGSSGVSSGAQDDTAQRDLSQQAPKCHSCGHYMQDDALFCSRCGIRVAT